ncbi:hypothetical protein PLICRDRAFT_551670 [Plicaturopsis crispa FD-325 SS-3]|nr:hypothetical protein PLICRDRAFT_551670 [Plicaturopsis crispa FD-325 SS-3]
MHCSEYSARAVGLHGQALCLQPIMFSQRTMPSSSPDTISGRGIVAIQTTRFSVFFGYGGNIDPMRAYLLHPCPHTYLIVSTCDSEYTPPPPHPTDQPLRPMPPSSLTATCGALAHGSYIKRADSDPHNVNLNATSMNISKIIALLLIIVAVFAVLFLVWACWRTSPFADRSRKEPSDLKDVDTSSTPSLMPPEKWKISFPRPEPGVDYLDPTFLEVTEPPKSFIMQDHTNLSQDVFAQGPPPLLKRSLRRSLNSGPYPPFLLPDDGLTPIPLARNRDQRGVYTSPDKYPSLPAYRKYTLP